MKVLTYIIEISNKEDVFGASGITVKHDIFDLGIRDIDSIEVSQLYKISACSQLNEIELLCKELLTDPITQKYVINENNMRRNLSGGEYIIEVWFKSGVTDAVGESVLKASKDMGLKNIKEVKTGLKYIIKGSKELTAEKTEIICSRLLANSVIQTYTIKK